MTALTDVIVDAHHHLWDPGRRTYGWLDGDALAPIRRRYGLDDLVAVTSAADVRATVLVQTVADVDESADFCATAADSDGLIAGVVGWVDLTSGDGVASQIEHLRAGPGGDRLVGIRHQVQDEADRDWLRRADVAAAIRTVGDAGLVYDLLVLTDQLASAFDIAGQLDTVAFVLDHAGKPPFKSGGDAMRIWSSGISGLASRPNVTCKLSGLATEADWTAWDAETLRPAVEHILDVFGPERVMFGSDWPVCELAGPYDTILATAAELTAGCTDDERQLIFGGTARRTYRLGGDTRCRTPRVDPVTPNRG